MNHSDSAKKSFAKMTFYAAKRVSKNDDFFAFSHFIPWCVFSKTRQGIGFHISGLTVKQGTDREFLYKVL